MDNRREEQEVLMTIQNLGKLGAFMDPFFKLTAVGTILLIQHFYRMYREGKLGRKEFQSIQEFSKLTKGNFSIENVPVKNVQELEKSGLLQSLEERGIRYLALPDLNKEDGFVQLAVYGADKEVFRSTYERFLMSRMQGGEHNLQSLNNLTSGRTNIISIPAEGQMQMIREDFASLQVNYAVLPDLNVGDGEIQLVVANTDLPKVEHWYQMYQEKCLSKGKKVGDFKVVGMEEYQETGKLTEEAYVDTASKELKEQLQKYEGKEPGELEKQLIEKESEMKGVNHEQYLKLHQDPEYIELTINEEALVKKSTFAGSPSVEKYGMFGSRVPQTWGKEELTLILPTERVFLTDNGQTFIGFVKKTEEPLLLGANGKPLPRERRMSGKELYERHYHTTKRDYKQLERTVKTPEKRILPHEIPQIEKIKIPKIPGRSR